MATSTTNDPRCLLWLGEKDRECKHIEAIRDLCREQLAHPVHPAAFRAAIVKTHLNFARPDMAARARSA